MERKHLLILTPICIFLLAVSIAFLFFSAQPATPRYILGEENGRVALYEPDSATPVRKYDIYTALLPADDARALQEGIGVQTPQELRRLLEDFGA